MYTNWHDGLCTEKGIPHPGRRQSDQTVQVDNEWTTAYAQHAYTAVINKKTYYALHLPDTDPLPTGALVLQSLTVDPDTGAVTVRYGNKDYTATPSTVDASKPKPSTITIDGVTYTRTK
jgi:hypothetical protein